MSPATRIPALMYHHVSDNGWKHKYYVAQQQFAEHMSKHAFRGWYAISLSDFFPGSMTRSKSPSSLLDQVAQIDELTK